MSAPRADRGLQPERTELAWRRTLLALAAGALVSVRVLPPVLGDWTLATGFGGVLVAAVLWVGASRRHRRSAAAFTAPAADRPALQPGGLLLAATAALTAGGALLGLLYLTAGAVRL